MRLVRVALAGFKTFAHRTELELGEGITAVVGPNGSGKSNLVDAIRWALGESNARELRGARMDEVIHSGGQGRPPMGFAEVEVVLDNAAGRLPVEDAEVSLARRVTRGGDSDYRLNGCRVRLRDVERLLRATGLTQAGYAVVAQDDVDAIIEATPAQRRALVEEAAGVRGLRTARDDALARCAAVDARLLRLRDLLADAEPRLEELAGQAEAALEQRRLVARVGELRGSMAREEWRAARGELRRARQRLSTAESRRQATAEAQAGFDSRLGAARTRLSTARGAAAAASRRLEEARVTAERDAGESRRYADRTAAAAQQRAAAQTESASARAAARRMDADLEGARADAGASAARLAHLAGEAAALEERRAQAEAGLIGAGEALRRAQEALEQLERRRDIAAAAAREHITRAALLAENAASLASATAAARERAGAVEEKAQLAARTAAQRAAAVRHATEAAASAGAALLAAQATAEVARNSSAAAQTAASEAEGRLAALSGRLDGALGGGPVARAVAAGGLEASRLADVIRVRVDADMAALDAALEGHLAAWVVEDLDAAARLLGSDASREEVLAAGLPLLPDPRPPQGTRAAWAAVAAEAQAGGAVQRCLESTWLAPDLHRARAAVAAAGGRAVLPDGTVVTQAGRRGGGKPGQTMALAAERRAAEARLGELQITAAERSAALAGAAAEAQRLAADAAAATAAAEAARGDAAALAATAAAEAAASRAGAARVTALERERLGREAAAASARRLSLAADDAARDAASAVAAAMGSLVDATAVRDARAAELEQATSAVRRHELRLAESQPVAEAAQRRLAAALAAALDEGEEKTRRAELRLLAAEEAALASLWRCRWALRRAAQARVASAVAAASADAAIEPAADLEAAVATLEAARAEVAVAAARAGDEHDAAAAEVVLAEERVAGLASAVRDDSADEAAEPDADAAERAEREITRLERRIAVLGPVNALAPEQHAVLAVRTGRLRSDHADLAEACADLRALAAHLGAEIDGRFEAVFGAVAYHFRLLFEELFSGGHATLRLQTPTADESDGDARTDPDVFVGPQPPLGVEILAQPAGRRQQPLSLLSGGERALTALAVILALQQVNPSPFYVFDEVDAPLDDANIGRFTRLLRRLAERQQFVLVTHNHATMAAADVLYGVTLGGDGCSRLLSVRLVEGRAVPVRQPAAAAS